MRFRQFGLPSVAEELTEHRLRKAKQLLAETLLPLDRIANLSGFANSDSMRNLFRHRFGLSTRAFRKARQSAACHDPRFDIPAFQFDSRHCTTP
jgi:transcriptional regulator GlxA family with amidase domain